ncbi:PHP-associated domain-containing protein [Halorubrum sp. AD140]|uniref:PHP-associated domain-containing protein n=1 Tax=Halorubrum sp. AD140 TaxID=3050073 RepID=UPI002ACCBCDC|nr:PHP-associated domain-containing protein [Halorubrum sp. AD140]MDZ5812860.1 PHP-associated domain-containing protein [Halorubrum sp. AD140]
MTRPRTRVDAHVKVLDDAVVALAKERGIDALVYAPHFTRLPTIRERAARYADDDLTIVPAREVFTGDWGNRRHLLVLGLTDPVPDYITFEAAMAEFDRQDAAVLVPHPGFATISLTRPEIAAHADRLAAVETYNTKLLPHQNARTRRIAETTDQPGFGTSYAHLPGTVGEAWTEFDGDLPDADAVVDAFREERPRTVVHRSGIRHQLRGLLEFAHLGYENTWEKLDRLFLSGDEPTLPSNVVYEGRFNDVSVYSGALTDYRPK